MYYVFLFALILIQAVCVVGAQCFLKKGLELLGEFSWSWACIKDFLSTWQIYAAGIAAIAGVLEWMFVLKHYPLSLAYPLTALSFIVSLFAGIWLFGEEVPLTRWIGVGLIMVGVFFMALNTQNNGI